MKKLIQFFANNKLLVNLITISIIVGGIFFVIQIKQDLFPETETDAMMITTSYPGASAKDVEINVTIPIEDKLKTINGIDNYLSSSSENRSMIFVIIDENISNTQEVKDEIRREMSSFNDLPDDANSIKVMDLSPSYKGVYEIGVYLEKETNLSDGDLYEYVDKLERELLKLSTISEVSIEGDREKEVKINVDPYKMKDYLISLNDISNSIKARNVRQSGGTIKSTTGTHNVVTIGQFNDPMDVQEVIIRSNFEQEQVKVKDIADVYYGFSEENVLSRVNSYKGVYLQVKKNAESDIVKASKEVKEFIEKTKKTIPDGFGIVTVRDESQTITSLLGVVKMNAVIGFILVFIMLLIFLMDIKVSFWTAFGIPITALITLSIMQMLNFTLNILTLGGIAMLLGILVDDGIIISENIVKYKAKGYSNIESAYLGVKEVAGAVFVSIFTTIVAFMPLLTIKGMMGKFIYVLPIVVLIALTVSFLEAIFLLPAHLVHGKNTLKKNKNHNWFKKVENLYKNFLKAILKYRYLVVLFFIFILFLTAFFSKDSLKKFKLVNQNVSDSIELQVVLKKELGPTIYETAKYVDNIEDEIRKELNDKELISIQSSVGHRQSSGRSVRGQHTNEAIIKINLTAESNRKRSTSEIKEYLRNYLTIENFPDFELLAISERRMGPDSGSAVDIKLLSNYENEAVKLVAEIEEYLETIPGIINIDNNIESERSELNVKFNHEKMAMLGVTTQTVASTIRTAYYGTTATTLLVGDDEIDFTVKVSEDSDIAKNENFLLDLLIPNSQGKLLRLRDFAYIEFSKTAYSFLHDDGYRVYEITADLESENKIRPNFNGNKTSQTDSQKSESIADEERQKMREKLKDLSPEERKKIVEKMQAQEGPKKPEEKTTVGNNTELTSLQITAMIEEKFTNKIQQNPYVDMKIGGEAEQSKEVLSDLGIAFLLALALVYFALIVLFKNFSQPMLVMLAIPFGITGALIAFMLHGINLDFFAIVGIIGLCGVVVNDCIVMIDFLNKQFKNAGSDDKIELRTKVSEGAMERLRPVILTTVTTSVGLLPTVYGIGGSSPFVTSIALAIAYGLMFATLITLFFIPSLYMIRLDFIQFSSKIKERIFKIEKK